MDFNLIFDLVLFAYGLYALRAWYMLKKAGELLDTKETNMIYLRNCTTANCSDPAGYYRYIMPRMLGFSLVLTLSGLITTVHDLKAFLPVWGQIAFAALSVLSIVYFCAILLRSSKRFFRS